MSTIGIIMGSNALVKLGRTTVLGSDISSFISEFNAT